MSTERKFNIGQIVKVTKTGETARVLRYPDSGNCCVVLVEREPIGSVELLYSEKSLHSAAAPTEKFEAGDTVEIIESGVHGRIKQIRSCGIDVTHFGSEQTTGPWAPSDLRKIESRIKPHADCGFKVGDRVEVIQHCVMAVVLNVGVRSDDQGSWFEIIVTRDDTQQISGPWAPSELRKVESTIEPADTPLPPTQQQIDGDHYRKLSIDPVEYSLANDLNCLQFSIVKHATRYPHKGEAITDLKKVIHYAQIALERQYNVLSQISYQEPT